MRLYSSYQNARNANLEQVMCIQVIKRHVSDYVTICTAKTEYLTRRSLNKEVIRLSITICSLFKNLKLVLLWND